MRLAPLAVVERDGAVESVHHGAYVALDHEGNLVASAGDPDLPIFGRSAWKPVQAIEMVACGLDVPDDLLAVVCSSHSASDQHVDAVRALLRRAGATEAALANTPDLPLDPGEMRRTIAAGGWPASVTANCSGKHAGMIATCLHNGWPVDAGAYLDPAHILQRHIWAGVRRLAGPTAARAGADGCGAPTFTCSLLALATAFRQVATSPEGSAENRVYEAMTAHPVQCAGAGRVATDLMLAVPGLVAKDGAEGVFAAAHPNGRAMALKISDGSARAWRPVLAEMLARLGFSVDSFEHEGILARGADGRALSRTRALLPGAS